MDNIIYNAYSGPFKEFSKVYFIVTIFTNDFLCTTNVQVAFVIAFPHFLHEVFFSIMMLSSFFFWFFTLKVVPLVNDLVMFVKF